MKLIIAKETVQRLSAAEAQVVKAGAMAYTDGCSGRCTANCERYTEGCSGRCTANCERYTDGCSGRCTANC